MAPHGRTRGSGRGAGRRFDAEHHVTTEALVFLGDLDPEQVGPGILHATHYEATPPAQIETLLDAIPIGVERARFFDLGCGMGRVLLLAARRPFRQVVGIEISPALHAIASQNLTSYVGSRACRDVRARRGDAGAARFPRGDLVVFLYNPFDDVLLERVLRKLLARPPDDELVIVYHTPVERAVIERTAVFTIEAQFSFGVVYRRITE